MNENLQPNFSSAFGYGWEIMKKHFWMLIGIVLISSLLNAIPSILSRGNSVDFNAFRSLFWILVSGPVSYGISWMFLKAARNEDLDIKDMFAAFSPNYWNVLVASLLVSVIIVLGFVLLIIPGIYLACKLAFVPYLVMDKGMKFSDAFSASWDMTKGHGWTIFGMGLMSILIILAGVLLLIVGVFPAIVWISASFASLYYAVDSKSSQTIEV
ncbi:MAG: hypothetical protein JXR65_04375 [Bacteroidales bacterium]|nr:hypothetical protein [Bacteroidales bacterium]